MKFQINDKVKLIAPVSYLKTSDNMPKGDIFNNDATGSLKGVIDAASKILMGVKDNDTAAAQTEEDHPIVKGQEDEAVEEAMSSKEKMKKGLYNSKMDPVDKKELKGKHKDRDDKDIDNDGDVDDSDKFLHKKRKAISKAMKKDGEEMDESKDVNDDNAAKAIRHDCATHVEHSEYGLGNCIPGMHTLEEDENGEGYVTHYDVMFENEDGEPFIVEDVAIEEMKVIKSMHHGHKKGK